MDRLLCRAAAVPPRHGKTLSEPEKRNHPRRHLPHTRIANRGNGRYANPEATTRCEQNRIDNIFGLPATPPWPAWSSRRRTMSVSAAPKRMPPCHCETRYGARFWRRQRQVAARIEASTQGSNIRYVAANLQTGSAERLYGTLHRTRGQAENPIEPHRSQLAPDRTGCRSPLAWSSPMKRLRPTRLRCGLTRSYRIGVAVARSQPVWRSLLS